MDLESMNSIAGHLRAGKMFSLAACVMLFYDILITFGDEVEKIWKQKFTLATILWFINRYLPPLGFVVITVSFHDPNWSKAACDRYILFPEISKLFTSLAIGSIFILRLYSLYGRSNTILVTFTCLLLSELAVKIWAFTDGTSLNLPPGLVGCILVGKDDSIDRFVYTWVAELIFDTTVFVATLYRTLVIYRRHRTGAARPLLRIMMRDGIIYFLVIFVSNVITVTFFLVLPADLKSMNASFSTLITSLMVSRLILNLRSQAARPRAVSHLSMTNVGISHASIPSERPLPTAIIGNLGEPVVSHWFESEMASGRSATGGMNRDSDSGYDKRPSLDNETGIALSLRSPTPLPAHIFVEVTRCVSTDVVSDDFMQNSQHFGIGTDCESDSYADESLPDHAFSRKDGQPTPEHTMRRGTPHGERPRSWGSHPRDSRASDYESGPGPDPGPDPDRRPEHEPTVTSLSESAHASTSEHLPKSAVPRQATTFLRPATATARPSAMSRGISSPWSPPSSWRIETGEDESYNSGDDNGGGGGGGGGDGMELKTFKSRSQPRTGKFCRPSTS